MKRTVSILICFVMLLSVISCGTGGSPKESKSTSENHEKYALWLSEYVGKYYGITAEAKENTVKIAGNTVLLADESDTFGLTSQDIPENAYAMRCEGNETVIVASSDGGFDRGVRELALNHADEGGILPFEGIISEGIGYKVGKITVCGNDIVDYVIYNEADGNASKEYAAEELQKYLYKTAGYNIPIVNEKPSGQYIELCFDKSENKALGAEGYRIHTENGNLIIEGGYRCGCLFGVYTLCEKYLGWRFLTNEIEYLYEADEISLDGIDFTDLPSMDYRAMYEGTYTSADFAAKMKTTVVGDKKYGGAVISNCCHGIIDYMHKAGLWEDNEEKTQQPCFTDDDTYEEILRVICEDIDKKVARGQKYGIGEDFCMVDVGQADNQKFCTCKNCVSYMRKHGSVASACTLYFANRVAEVMAEKYPGIYVATFGYYGTNIPPEKMTVLDNVVVSYCFYIPCNNHSINGKDCESGGWNNINMSKECAGWCAICKNVNCWYYPWQNYGDITLFNIYDDFVYLSESGANGVLALMPVKNDLSFSYLLCYLCGRASWSADTITKDEFDALIIEFFKLCYGDAYDELWEILYIWNRAGDLEDCWTGGWHTAVKMNNMEYFGEKYDYLCELFDYVIRRANCERTEEYMKTLYCTVHYLGICAVHTDRYLNGTDEQRTVIAERYEYMYNRYKSNNIKIESEGQPYTLPDELNLNQNPEEWDWKHRK